MELMCETILDQYFTEHVCRKVVARKRQEEIIHILKGFFTGKPVRSIDIPLCREYREHREHCTDSTVRRELGVLKAAVNHALRWRRLKGMMLDEFPSFELPPESDVRPIWLFKEELATLLEHSENLDNRVFRFVQIAYHTASRKRAVETLPWGRVDETAKLIDLQDPELPRTKKRRPIVAISENMSVILSSMRSIATSPFVLENDDDIRPAFDKVARSAGLEYLPNKGIRAAGRLTPHILRHSRATHMLQDGKLPWAVANQLGDSLITVLRVYGHHCPEYQKDAVS